MVTRRQRGWLLAVGLCTLGPVLTPTPAMSGDMRRRGGQALATDRPALVLVYNKRNPRWEAPDRGPHHQFTKPYKPLHQPPGNLPPKNHKARHGSEVLNRFVVLIMAAVAIAALAAEWLSTSLHLPPAWIALLCGLVLGPVTGLFDPAVVLGTALLPLIALCFVVLLCHDLLRARAADLRNFRAVVARLISLEAGIICVGTAVIAAIIGLDPAPAALLAALLVIAQDAAHIETDPEMGTLLTWEGVGLEIAGVVLALVVGAVALAGHLHRDSGPAVASVATTVIGGSLAGVVLGHALTQLLRRGWIAEPARQPLLLAVVLTAFALPNLLHDGCGFFAVLGLGLYLANQRQVKLVTPGGMPAVPPALTSGLLIVLAASVRLDEMTPVDAGALVSLVALLAAARLATWRARLPWREQLALAGAASTTAIAIAAAFLCALRLGEVGVPQAQLVVTLAVLVVFVRLSVASVASVFETRWWRAAASRPDELVNFSSGPQTSDLRLQEKPTNSGP